MTIKNLWDAGEAVLRGKFIVIQSCLRKQKNPTNIQLNLTMKATREKRTNKTQN